MRGESMKDKSKKSTYSTTFGVDPKEGTWDARAAHGVKVCECFIYGTKKPAKRLLKRA